MAKGCSLHIGLNTIDTGKYRGEYRQLRNAENDATYYYELAGQKGFAATILNGKDATSENLLNKLGEYAGSLVAGDLLFLSYSGHGTRVIDLNGDEPDGYDEVLVLYDRLFIDDEFQLCWPRFKPGVKIFFINDSCYNGTVSRVFDLHEKAVETIYPGHILRGIDLSESNIDLEENKAFYESIKLDNPGQRAACSIIHIGACQDNQLADDGSGTDANGKFTATVKTILDAGTDYSYKSLFNQLMQNMPPWQTPCWDTDAGAVDELFEKSGILVF